MLRTLAKALVIGAVAGIAVGGLFFIARFFGLAIPAGVMIGIIIAVAAGMGNYLAKPRGKEARPGTDPGVR